jgi:hypothetical protein
MSDHEGFCMDFGEPDYWQQYDANGFIGKATPLLNPPIIQVYLAGPLTCVDPSDGQDCDAIRKITKHVLGSYDYRGLRFRVYDPADVTQPGSQHTPEQVYEVDYRNVVDADLVIFHVNVPSLGVGEESQIAAASMVPRVTVRKRGAKVSRMFDGTFTPAIRIEYSSYADYEKLLRDQLVEIAEKVVSSAVRRRAQMKVFEDLDLGRFIFRQRIRHSIKIEELAAKVDTKVSWLQYLERSPRIAATASLPLIQAILDATNSKMSQQPGKTPDLQSSDEPLPDDQKQSIENLIDFIRTQQEWVPDPLVFRLWTEYQAEVSDEQVVALTYREGHERIIAVTDWAERYRLIAPPRDDASLFPEGD